MMVSRDRQQHSSYFPEEVVWVHPDCHQEIYRTALYPHLKSPDGGADVYYGRKLCREHRQEQSFFYVEACNYDPEHPRGIVVFLWSSIVCSYTLRSG
jgi:hypothetical protein